MDLSGATDTVPRRIQMSRQRPWRAEHPDAVIVARPTKWGNPFTVVGAIQAGYADNQLEGRAVAVEAFRDWLHGDTWAAGASADWDERRLDILTGLRELAGRDLACWCKLTDACHADVLLELANAREEGNRA